MIRLFGRRALTMLGIAALLLSACTPTQPTRFYTLSGLMTPPADPTPDAPSLGFIGVGPVTLPAYVDRPQIVRRAGATRVVLADFDSWIEPLDSMVPRVLVENLSLLLGTDDIWLLGQRRPPRLDYQVEVDVTRFDANAESGDAVLDARWFIYGGADERLLASDRATILERATPSDGLEGEVAAMSRAVGELSRELAEAIQAAARQRR
jgi:uncharacterized lipoprotein YmbA